MRQPDLLFVSKERADLLGERIEGGPDLVVEIISPSNTWTDIEGRLADYASIDVRECWLVYPQIRAAEVLRLDDGEWRRNLHSWSRREFSSRQCFPASS